MIDESQLKLGHVYLYDGYPLSYCIYMGVSFSSPSETSYNFFFFDRNQEEEIHKISCIKEI